MNQRSHNVHSPYWQLIFVTDIHIFVINVVLLLLIKLSYFAFRKIFFLRLMEEFFTLLVCIKIMPIFSYIQNVAKDF